MKLHYDKKIVFFTIQEYAKATNTPITDYCLKGKLVDGYTIIKEDFYIVLYNKNLCANRRNWTIAHEIGHIYLGHEQDTEVEEIEAHFFAAQLLMPEFILYKVYMNIGKLTEKEILDLFFVSSDAAKKRILTFQRKHKYSCTKDDRLIWDVLEKDVTAYCRKHKNDQKSNPLPYFLYEDNSFYKAEEEWLYGFL